MDNIWNVVVQYGLNFIFAVLIFIVGRFVAKLISQLTEKLMLASHIDKTLCLFCKNLTFFFLMAVVIVSAVAKLGIETTSIVAMLGAAGLAIGLALQGTLSNFAAGVILIIFKPFKVEDAVSVDGVVGTVEEIQIFTTILKTPDNQKIIIPNSKITGDKIVNFTDVGKRRIDLTFSISYSDDMKKAKEVLKALADADSRVLKDQITTVAVSALGESSVDLICRPWVKPEDYWKVRFDLIEKGKIALESAGMTIPFPQRDIHVYNK